MPRPARAFFAAFWAAGLLACAALLERPSPLFVNLGAGDEPFTVGFRGRWEREGRRGNPETMFRWTEDGARLRLPVGIAGPAPRIRLRMARFSPEPAEMLLRNEGRVIERWRQDSRGMHVREFALGPARAVDLQFRSESADQSPVGLALDWMEVLDAGGLRPPAGIALRAAAVLIAIPFLAAALAATLDAAFALGALFAWGAALGLAADRLGTLLALDAAFLPVLLATAALAAALAVLRRGWRDAVDRRAVVVPVAAITVWLALVLHPFYYYPDVDRHRVLLHALQGNPSLLADPVQPWPEQVTREIGGHKVALPYAFVFHAVAWPLAGLLGEAAALKTAGVAALGMTLLLVFPFARAAGLGFGAAVAAQALAAAIPVSTSRVVLALHPTLLGQAVLVLLLVHLARRLGHLDGARDAAAATAFLLLAQLVYTGSLIGVGALAVALTVAEFAAGEWRRALRLLGAWGVATAIVLAQYAGFFPVLWSEVLPHVGGSAAAAPGDDPSAAARGLTRLKVFFDTLLPLLAAAGLAVMRTAVHARRVILSALAAGVVLAFARFVVPSLLADAKEVELMVAPVAVASAGALAWGWTRGRGGRAASIVLGLAAFGWGAWQSGLHYAARFTAAGR
jgi:hypothetical protein